jgi:hypothetical protein
MEERWTFAEWYERNVMLVHRFELFYSHFSE